MAEAILDLRLDTVQPNRVRLVYGVQNDYNSRYICARFTVNGKPIDIEKTAAVRINAKRPDGNKDAFPGTVNTDGTAKVPVAQWMLDVPGEVSASITAVTTSGALTTQEFYIMAKASLWDSTGEPDPENPDKDVIQMIIASENERVIAEAERVANENARKSAETARATAETKRIADEAERVANEAGRVSAEEIRREEFATWQDEWGKISSFDKRLENLEAAISPEIVTPVVDDTVAYQKTVPKGALPNAAITEIGGMSYVKNGVLVDSKVTAVESVGRCLIPASAVYGSFATEVEKDGRKCFRFITGSSQRFNPIKFKEKTSYTIRVDACSVKKESAANNVDWIFAFYYTDGTNSILNNTPDGVWRTKTLVSDAGKTVSAIGIAVQEWRIDNYVDIESFLFVEGTEIPEDCKPYFRESLPIPADALDGWGQGVNAQYCNKIVLDPLEGVKKYVNKVKTVVLDGATSKVGYVGETNGKYYANFTPSVAATSGTNFVSSHLTKKWADEPGNIYIDNWGNFTMFNTDQSLTSVAKWNEWLQSNNITICYELATPTETDVSHLFTDDNLLPVEAGGTITAVNEYEQAVPFTIEYTVKGA